jgi:hypothetical protein
VHLVRHSLNFCGWKDRKNVAKDLKRIYQATDDVEAEKALADFEAEWGQKYPSIAPSWRRAWQEVIPFFAFPPEVRKIIYTTNAIESLNRVIRKTTKTRGSFPTDDAATKLIYLAIRSFKKAGRYVREWPPIVCKQTTAGNSVPHETSSLSYTQNGSTDDPFKPHGLSRIHRVSDTPGRACRCGLSCFRARFAPAPASSLGTEWMSGSFRRCVNNILHCRTPPHRGHAQAGPIGALTAIRLR